MKDVDIGVMNEQELIFWIHKYNKAMFENYTWTEPQTAYNVGLQEAFLTMYSLKKKSVYQGLVGASFFAGMYYALTNISDLKNADHFVATMKKRLKQFGEDREKKSAITVSKSNYMG
jgi:hypothetical protein